MEFAQLRRVKMGGYQRIIVVSDIHGNGHLLKRLLNELSFSSNDALFLLGDFIERGTNSLETVRYAMSLCKAGNAFALQGNCDTLWDDLTRGLYCMDINAYIDWRRNSLLADMCAELGLDRKLMGARKVSDELNRTYGDVFDWLRALPHIIETENLVFVHAGIDEGDIAAQNAERCVKREAFLEEDVCFDKTVICGHMPLCNYFHITGDRLCYRPLLDRLKNIVAIDGGNAVKRSGQLNAFVLEGAHSYSVYADDLPMADVCGEQEQSVSPSSVAWNHREVDLIEEHATTSLCIVKYTGKQLEIPNELLFRENGIVCSDDYTDNRLSLKPGDQVKLLNQGEIECLVKNEGIIGWMNSSLLTHR